jgi:hypothetical protein
MTHLMCCTTTVTLKGQSHLPCIGPQSLNGAPQNCAPSLWFHAIPSSRQYMLKNVWLVLLRSSTFSRNCTTARGIEGEASAKARRLSSSFRASFAKALACLRKASILLCENFVFLLVLLESTMNSLSFLAAVLVISDAS